MGVLALLEGLVVGFLASVPLGPIGVVCIQRTLNKTRFSGLFSGLGAATADTIFATIAVFSLSFLTEFIELHKVWFTLTGGGLIAAIGVTIFLKPVKRPSQRRNTRSSLVTDYFSILFLTLTNPAYILLFLTLFAALGITSGGSGSNTLLLAGVLGGAGCWWFILTTAVNKLRGRFRLRHLWWINKITGGIVVAFGALVVVSSVVDLGPLSHIL